MLSSKIIRHVVPAATVFIGERQHDALAEVRAEDTFSRLFPTASLITGVDGAKLMPVLEVHKLEAHLRREQEQAQRRGHEEGHKQGLEKGLAEARKVLKDLEGSIQDVINQRARLLEESKQKILDLVLQISKKVTFDALEIDREATVGLIDGVINQLVDRSRIKIKVHPSHLPVVERHLERFLSGSTAIKDIKIEADPRVRLGGCFIETPTGDIDARLESQFEVVGEVLHSGEGRS
jgi:flagellar biosynthesis/type III secretory pathway protein FliH